MDVQEPLYRLDIDLIRGSARRDPRPGPLPRVRGSERAGAAGPRRDRRPRGEGALARSAHARRGDRVDPRDRAAPGARSRRRSSPRRCATGSRPSVASRPACPRSGCSRSSGRPRVRGRALGPRDGRARRRHEPAERARGALAGRDLARDRRAMPEVVVFMPCGYYLEEAETRERPCSSSRPSSGSPPRGRRASSRSTPRPTSRGRDRGSSTAWRSSPGRCTPRPSQSPPTDASSGSARRVG